MEESRGPASTVEDVCLSDQLVTSRILDRWRRMGSLGELKVSLGFGGEFWLQIC
jgi:hypothetical protein